MCPKIVGHLTGPNRCGIRFENEYWEFPWTMRMTIHLKQMRNFLSCFAFDPDLSVCPSRPSFTPMLQVRNRFADVEPLGGYRDVNVKIRVGFKGDPKDGRPLFCPVCVQFVHSTCASLFVISFFSLVHCFNLLFQENVGWQRCQNNGMCCKSACDVTLILLLQCLPRLRQ